MPELLLDEKAEEKIGPQIRMLRTRCGMSIRQMAERAGVTPAIISCIERGMNSPSISTLSKILAAMDTNLQAFFGGNGNANAGPVFRREHMQSISDVERSYTMIFPRRGDIKMEMLDEHLHPTEPLPEFESLECDVAGYLVSGQLCLEIAGEDESVLRPGDAFYVPKGTSHRGHALGETPAHLITVCYPAKY